MKRTTEKAPSLSSICGAERRGLLCFSDWSSRKRWSLAMISRLGCVARLVVRISWVAEQTSGPCLFNLEVALAFRNSIQSRYAGNQLPASPRRHPILCSFRARGRAHPGCPGTRRESRSRRTLAREDKTAQRSRIPDTNFNEFTAGYTCGRWRIACWNRHHYQTALALDTNRSVHSAYSCLRGYVVPYRPSTRVALSFSSRYAA